MRLSLACCLLFVVNLMVAQSDCQKTYDQESIYLRSELFRGTVFVKNGVAHSVGFNYKNLQREMENSPNALLLYKKGRRNAQFSFVTNVLGLVGTAAGAYMALQSVDSQGYLLNERRYQNGLRLMLGSTALSAAISIPLQTKARRQIDDAVWLRNRDLFEPKGGY